MVEKYVLYFHFTYVFYSREVLFFLILIKINSELVYNVYKLIFNLWKTGFK